LECNKALSIENLPLYGLIRMVALPCLKLLSEVCRVLLAAAGVSDDVELVGKASNNRVVDDAASLGV
jgi:hypothetical protein